MCGNLFVWYRGNKMPVKSRPGTEKAALVDELARLGGDDYRFWGDDGDGTVDSQSQEFKDYSGITVAVLRSRVANFSPQRGDSEEEEQSEREESSEEESDEEFFEPEPADDVDRSPAAAAAVTPAPWFGGIFGGPADITPAKQALASGNLSDDDDLAAAVSAQRSHPLLGADVACHQTTAAVRFQIASVADIHPVYLNRPLVGHAVS
jgi:hypothetical protein